MHKWQQDYLDSIKGINSGQISGFMAGRRVGKSMITEQMLIQQSKYQKQLIDEGWLSVGCSEYFFKNWSRCHDQCKQLFGEPSVGYTWTGDIFWFKTEEDIMLFKLTFGA